MAEFIDQIAWAVLSMLSLYPLSFVAYDMFMDWPFLWLGVASVCLAFAWVRWRFPATKVASLKRRRLVHYFYGVAVTFFAVSVAATYLASNGPQASPYGAIVGMRFLPFSANSLVIAIGLHIWSRWSRASTMD